MSKFLEKVVAEINLNELDLIKTCFVLPNKRSSIKLKALLLKRQTTTSFSPKICSIDEFIFSISGLNDVHEDHLKNIWIASNNGAYLIVSSLKIS